MISKKVTGMLIQCFYRRLCCAGENHFNKVLHFLEAHSCPHLLKFEILNVTMASCFNKGGREELLPTFIFFVLKQEKKVGDEKIFSE